MKTNIYLIRHTQTLGNKECRLTGKIDYDITDNGKIYAEKLTESLRNINFQVAYSSTLSRTKKTIQKLADINGISIIEKENLCEMDFGDYDGMKWEEINSIDPNISKIHNELNVIKNIPNQESMEHVAERMYMEILNIAKENIGKNILICSHGVAIETFLRKISGIPFDEQIGEYSQENTSVNILSFNEKDNSFTIEKLNDIGHLNKKFDLISVIVPVYKVEKYLRKCLKSIMAQTYKNLEIILVDDGSPDNCGKICDEFASKDKRIKVIHKKNGGLSDARNEGLRIANGKYIGFVDSDDYIVPNMFDSLYNLAKSSNADISMVSFYKIRDEKIMEIVGGNSGKIEQLNKIDAMKELLLDERIKSNMWNKLFRKELFENIEFPVNKEFEDIATTLLLFEKSNKVAFLQEPRYYYRQRNDSIYGSMSYKAYKDRLDVSYNKFIYLDDKYEELNIFNAYNYILNILHIYAMFARCDYDDSGEDFDKAYDLFKILVKKYGNELVDKFNNYDKALLYLMLLDKENVKESVKQLHLNLEKIKNNPNANF